MRSVADPDYVVVSGPPGSGKSTIAVPLASLLGLPLFAKDTIKEALMDVLGVETVDDSRRLGAAAIATMLALARANGRAVLDSTWRASLAVHDVRALGGVTVEVFCDVDPAVSRRRYVERASSRHHGHFDQGRGEDMSLWQGEAAQPIAGGWPVIRVDTSAPVDIERLLLAIRAAGPRT